MLQYQMNTMDEWKTPRQTNNLTGSPKKIQSRFTNALK